MLPGPLLSSGCDFPTYLNFAVGLRQCDLSFYIQGNHKVGNRLTLNLASAIRAALAVTYPMSRIEVC